MPAFSLHVSLSTTKPCGPPSKRPRPPPPPPASTDRAPGSSRSPRSGWPTRAPRSAPRPPPAPGGPGIGCLPRGHRKAPSIVLCMSVFVFCALLFFFFLGGGGLLGGGVLIFVLPPLVINGRPPGKPEGPDFFFFFLLRHMPSWGYSGETDRSQHDTSAQGGSRFLLKGGLCGAPMTTVRIGLLLGEIDGPDR